MSRSIRNASLAAGLLIVLLPLPLSAQEKKAGPPENIMVHADASRPPPTPDKE